MSKPSKRSKTFSHLSSIQISLDARIDVDINDDNDETEEIQPPHRPLGRDKVEKKNDIFYNILSSLLLFNVSYTLSRSVIRS